VNASSASHHALDAQCTAKLTYAWYFPGSDTRPLDAKSITGWYDAYYAGIAQVYSEGKSWSPSSGRSGVIDGATSRRRRG